MAALLGYSLRQYQRLEDADDGNLPGWKDLERIMDVLNLSASTIFDDEAPEVSADGTDRLEEVLARVEGVHEDLRTLRGLVESLLEDRAQAR